MNLKTMLAGAVALAAITGTCGGTVSADSSVLTNGFTLTLNVNLDAPKGAETLYELGPMKLVLRPGERGGYDESGGNYLHFPLADGSCPVLEATICAKAGRVGIPLGCLANPAGDHLVTLDLSPARWSIGVDGRRDEDFPLPSEPVVWKGTAVGKSLSPRVKDVSFATPARKDAFPPEPDRKPITRSIQYWTPDDHNAWVGDVAPATLNGALHVFYLLDRRHHGSGAGIGRHQFAHVSTSDLRNWTEHPLAVPIRESWQTVGTGTPFLKDGHVALAFGWHTTRFKGLPKGLPVGGTYATSTDDIHFTNSGQAIGAAQNPSVYTRPDGSYLQLGSHGGGGMSTSKDLVKWDRVDARIPIGGDCPALFDWHGHRYLLQGFTGMAYSEDAKSNVFVNWSKEPDKLYDGLAVPMVVPWKDDRRIYIGWMGQQGWGGWLVFREVVYYPDGHLGLKWVPEIEPPTPPRDFRVPAGRRFSIRCKAKGGGDILFTVDPQKRVIAFSNDRTDVEPAKRVFAQTGGVRGLDRDYTVRLIAHYDAKAGQTILDAEVAGQRTLIAHCWGRYELEEPVIGKTVALKDAVSLPADPRPSERYAAEEWCKWASQVTGRACAVVPEAEAGVVLRRDDSLGEDGFWLETEGDRLVIRGGRRGILHGVYETLERFAGVGWFSRNTTVVPKAERIEVPVDLAVSERPAFELRQPLFHELSTDPDFSARLRVNASQLKERHGGCSHRFDEKLGNCHTFDWLVPPKEYFKDHPEYYSEIDGRRTWFESQLCLTNPDVLRIVTEKVLERMRANPGARYFGVSQNDNRNYCRCEKCAAIDREEGSHAGTLLRFVNAVAEAVEKEFPDKVIETLVYQYTRKPPRITKARPNVMPCLCSIECDFSVPLATSPNANSVSFMEDLRGWSRQTDQLYVWDYVVNFEYLTHPMPNVLVLQDNLKTFRDNKVKSIFEQGNNRYRHSDFGALKAYLLAKWMWDPDLPIEPLLGKFFAAYYGKAAPLARRYFDELHALPRDPHWQALSISEGNCSTIISDEFLDRMAKVWDRAEELVKDDPVPSYNVRMERLSVDLARLMRHRRAEENWPEYQALAKKTLAAFEEGRVNFDEKAYTYGELFGDWRKMAAHTYAEMNADLTLMRPEGFRPAFALDRLFFTPGDRYKLQVHVRGGRFSARVGVFVSHVEYGGVTVEAKDVPDEGKWFDVCTWRVEPGEFVSVSRGPGAVFDGVRLVPAP